MTGILRRSQLQYLPPGTRFRLPGFRLIGTLLAVSESSAKVRYDRGVEEVEICDREGNVRSFLAHRKTDTTIAPATVVEVLNEDPIPESELMNMTTKTKAAKKNRAPKAAKKSTKQAVGRTATVKAAKEPKAKRAAKEPKAAMPPRGMKHLDGESNGKVSQLDAAAMVLRDTGGTLTCQEMVTAMTQAGLWSSPGGKTPAATLYSGLIREIDKKGADSRFEKVERGQFRLK